jgi:metal-responsive CopG/Arc/MetJ family transcriptional regulator
MKDPMIHVRLDPTLVKMIDYLAVDWASTRSGAVERLIREALRKYDARGDRDRLLVSVS